MTAHRIACNMVLGSAFLFTAGLGNDPSTSWLSHAQFDSAGGGTITQMNAIVTVPGADQEARS